MNIVKVALTSLLAPFGSTDAAFTLTKLLDSKGNPVTLSDFGTWLVVVLKSGTTSEMVKCNSIVNNDDGSVTVGVSDNGRDLDPTSPYAGSSTGQDFPAGADAIITNDPYTMSHFVNDEDDHSIAGVLSFAQVPNAAADPVGNNDLTRKSWVSALVLGTLTTIDVIVPGTAGATIAAGNLVYFDVGSGQWKLATAATAATVNNVLLGIAQGAGTSGNSITNGILLQGVDAHQTGLSAGVIQYASNTPGAISASAGTTIVVVGIAKDATHLYFDPRFDQQITQNQMDALAGQSGTAPSSANKYEDNADTAATATPGKLVRANGSGNIDTSFLPVKFGGTGADGALTITSGTTTISMSSASYIEKNYTSISITGSGNLAFSNPGYGSVVVLRSQGNVTITTSSTSAIDVRNMGGGNDAFKLYDNPGSTQNGNGGAGGGSTTGRGNGGAVVLGTGVGAIIMPGLGLAALSPFLRWAAPGGNGCDGSTGGTNGFSGGLPGGGGLGGGGLYIECAGAYTFTTGAINASGQAGTSNTHNVSGGQQGGAGGGGGGGNILVLYATLTADSGTYNVAAGAGGTGIFTGVNGNAGAPGSVYRAANNYF